MSDTKNMELSDEMMENAVGGTEEKGRIENATVIGPWNDNPWQIDVYRVRREGQSGDTPAHYGAINILLPGTKVKVQLVGMGKWDIVDILN